MSRRQITHIVIHCAATPNGNSLKRGGQTPAQVIDGWHRDGGFLRSPANLGLQSPTLRHIGYHFVIGIDGVVEEGRHLDEVGAHVAGKNSHSIGICLVGTTQFTRIQWRALRQLVDALAAKYPKARICGHRDLSPDRNGDGKIQPWEWLKLCPGFDVARWVANGKEPDPAHVLEIEP